MKTLKTLILAAWSVCGVAFAQSPVERAVVLGSQGQWDQALELLQPAVGGAYRTDAHAWYILGLVQKERFKISTDRTASNPERLASIQAFERCIALGGSQSEEGRTSALALEFMAESFFRDAYAALVQFVPGGDDRVLDLLKRYEAHWSSLHPETDFTEQEFDLYHRLAEANSALLEPALGLSVETRRASFERAIAHYEAAGALMPNDERTQFNLAVTWYNEGVRKIRDIDSQVTLTELMRIQSECVNYFKQALIPMQAAYALNPEKLSTLNGLKIIHRALEQREESARFEAELEALKDGH